MLWVKASGSCLVHHVQVLAGSGDVTVVGGGVVDTAAGAVGGAGGVASVAGAGGGVVVVAGGVGGATGAGCWDRARVRAGPSERRCDGRWVWVWAQ